MAGREMALALGFCDTCRRDVMNEKCSGVHCSACGLMIELEVEGPVYADDKPTASLVDAFECSGCMEPCHNVCAGHICEAERFCQGCWYSKAEPSA